MLQRCLLLLMIVSMLWFSSCGEEDENSASPPQTEDILSATPPMGWNSWNKFHCDIDEALIRQTADAMVETGLRDAGYVYLNVDDCWQVSRDEKGRIVADPERFPSGIPALAEYVHSKGLKFGLYTDVGPMTCQDKPGSYNYEEIDAQTYAEWKVDYVKVDWCHNEGLDPRERYRIFRDALNKAGRPIVFSICNWGVDMPWIWGPTTGQLWRTTGDIGAIFASVLLNFTQTEKLAAYASAGHWNDPDMLEIGNGEMTEAENRSHMSLWSILSAPLIAGNDLRAMSAFTKETLTNPEVIAVNQDRMGLQGVRVSGKVNEGVWAKPLSEEGLRAVVLFNGRNGRRTLSVQWSQLGLQPGVAQVRDLWARKDLGQKTDGFELSLEPHDAAMITVQGQEPTPEMTWVSALPFKFEANSRGPVERDQSVGGENAGDGQTLSIAGKSYEKGLGVGAGSIVMLHLGGQARRFISDIGVDDSAGTGGSVTFQVIADHKILFESPLMKGGDTAQSVDLDISGKRWLKLVVTPGDDNPDKDFANWAGARLE